MRRGPRPPPTRLCLAVQPGLRHRVSGEDRLPGDRPARGWIVLVPGQDMSAHVRDGVPECHVVQLDRLESCPHRPSRREDLRPVPARLKRVQIAGRALVYGFARMNIDGHFPRWGVAEAEAERTAEAILDLFIEGIAKRPD